jgi:15-cis-phytoene synthase
MLTLRQSLGSDLAACRRLLHGGSKTFLAASHLLPSAVRDAACALYAFCRVADDAVDLVEDKHQAVQQLQQRLDAIYAGTPWDHSADRALQAVVNRYAIPRALPGALLDGFAWDAQYREYQTLADLHDYCARVAGTVGTMMAMIMGVRSPEGLARATDLGVAMQLSNIARDVGEDARAGRLFLPLDWLEAEGIDRAAWLHQPAASPALGRVIERLLAEADRLYGQVDRGLHLVPANCRLGIAAARTLYAQIGHEVRKRALDSVSQRAVVSTPTKARLMAHAYRLAQQPRRSDVLRPAAPAVPANQYLIEAAVSESAAPAFIKTPYLPWWHQARRAVWMLEMFDEVEQRRQSRRPQALPDGFSGISH